MFDVKVRPRFREVILSCVLCLVLLGCVAAGSQVDDWEDTTESPNLTDNLRHFFSENNQRELITGLSDQARLATNSRGRLGQAINTQWVNGEDSQSGRPGTAFYFSDDEARVLMSDPSLNQSNLIELNQAAKTSAQTNPDMIRLNFRGETLEYFIQQTLGGILQVNYIIDEPLEGAVVFQAEKPIPKEQLLSLVRVMLGRNGYILKLIDRIFHVGRPELIQAIEQNAGFGAQGDLQLRLLPIRSAKADAAARVLQAVLPNGASAIAIEGSNEVAVRARPEDIEAAIELVNNLYNRDSDKAIVSVLRLQQSPASQVAAQVLSLFERLYPNQSVSPVTIIPLETQQSLLVAVKSKAMLERVHRTVKELDYSLLDIPKVRIISLSYLPAEEIAGQLTAILGEAGDSGEQSQQSSSNSKDNKASSTAKSGGDRISQRVNATNNLFNGEGERGASSISAPSDVNIVPDSRNNALLVNSTFKQFKHIKEVVAALDLPLSQVVIEATIAEVEINDRLSYGVQWFLAKGAFSGGSGSVPSNILDTSNSISGSPGGAVALSALGVDVVLQALQEVTQVKVISSPYLTVLDGRQARLVVGDQVPIATRSQENSVEGNVAISSEIDVRDTGIVLQVEPNIRSNNSVLLNIEQEVSNVSTEAVAGSLTPTIQTRTINSDIVVESGRTILLGGLIQERQENGESGVPILRKIPVFGELFKDSTSNNVSRTELLVMITPRVIRKQSELQQITEKLRRELSTF